MKITLARVDDRLIHGQVTVGWSQKLRPDRIVLVNDSIAADPWQARVYRSSVPPEIAVSILSVADASDLLCGDGGLGVNESLILLTASPAEMAQLAWRGVPLARINIGGLHFSPGKQELLPFVFLGPQDLLDLLALAEAGYELFAQQVPGGREVVLDRGLLQEMEAHF